MNQEEKQYLFQLGQKIDALYRKKYKSQNEFAKAVECDNRTIRRIIRGEQNISLLLLRRIAESLDCPLYELLMIEKI